MTLKKAILRRRSVRRFQKKMLNIQDIRSIITAGIWAPSGLNNQPWKFKVIDDGQTKCRIAGCTKYASIIINAPVIICVFLDKSKSYNRDKDIMATGACIENMLLLAYSKNIGSCWLGEILNEKKRVRMILHLNPNYELMAVLALGYPLRKPGKGSRRKLESFILN